MDRLGLSGWLCETCLHLRMSTPTLVQKRVIPYVLRHASLLCRSETGSGKTGAYTLPLLQHLCVDMYGVFGLILTPSRELALQCAHTVKTMGHSVRVRVCVCVGGEDIAQQSSHILSAPHFIVATPGRLAYIIHDKTDDVCRKFKHLHTLVLDEADKLFNESLCEDMDTILSTVASNRKQTLFFTATLTEELKKKAELICGSDLHTIDLNPNDTPVESIQQFYVFLPLCMRLVYLTQILRNQFKQKRGIVFVGQTETCQGVTSALEYLKFEATCLHAAQTQRTRKACLAKFRNEMSDVLVATDVASRGLDFSNVFFVINFDLPKMFEEYTHRVGRCGRHGLRGVAVSFVTQRQNDPVRIHFFEERMGVKLKEFEIDEENALTAMSEITRAQKESALKLKDVNFTERVEILRKRRKPKLKKRKA